MVLQFDGLADEAHKIIQRFNRFARLGSEGSEIRNGLPERLGYTGIPEITENIINFKCLS